MAVLHEAVVFMAAALIAVPIFKRLGFGSILGYLVAGVVIGPSAFALVADVEHVLHFSELGVVFLLFIIGLELQPMRLWALKKPVFGLGSAQVLVTGAALSGAGILFGLETGAAAVAGLGLALSSTAFALQIMAEKGELTTRHGRAGFSILLFQDLAVIPMIAVIPLLGAQAGLPAEGSAWLGFAKAAAVIAAVVIVGRIVLRPYLRMAAATRSGEIFTAAALLVVLGTALIMELAGLSMALGAFLAGVLLADSEYRHELEANIEPFKGLLLGLFFIAVGMSVDLDLIFGSPLLVLGLALGLMAVKALVLYGLGRFSGLKDEAARRLAVTLPQGGEFAFVLFGFAVTAGVIDGMLSGLLIAVVSLSMALTPFAVMANEALCRKSGGGAVPDFDRIEDREYPVIIAGFGRFGQIVARCLRVRGIGFTALDASFEQIDFVRKFGNKVYFGDASRLDLLRAAGAETAKAFVLAVDDVEASVKIAEMVRKHFPGLKIYARAHNRIHAFKLMELGVVCLERETVAASLDLAVKVFQGLGSTADEARGIVEAFRKHDEQLLLEQYELRHDEKAFIENAKQAAERLEGLFERDSTDMEKAPAE